MINFIKNIVRPHVLKKDMHVAYKEMATDKSRETEALEWAEATVGDINRGNRAYFSPPLGLFLNG